MNVLELVQMRAAVLSPVTKRDYDWHGNKLNVVRKRCMRRDECRLRGIRMKGCRESSTFDGERKRTRLVPRQTGGSVSSSRVVGGPKRDDKRGTDEG